MNVEKFADGYGNDVYALALIMSKSAESAAEVFLKAAAGCGKFENDPGTYNIVTSVFPLCKQACSNQYAETLSTFALSKKQEELLSEIFAKPQIIRAILHLYYENDLAENQISAVTNESLKFVSKQISALPEDFKKRMDKHYKEICLKLIPDSKLKEKAVREVKDGKKRLFEITDEALPRHKWTKRGKAAAVITAVIAAIIIYLVIPIMRDFFANMAENNAEETYASDMKVESDRNQ